MSLSRYPTCQGSGSREQVNTSGLTPSGKREERREVRRELAIIVAGCPRESLPKIASKNIWPSKIASSLTGRVVVTMAYIDAGVDDHPQDS